MNCPVCINDNIAKTKVSIMSPYNHVRYTLYKCKKCKLEFWDPIKIVPELYEDEFIESYKVIHSGSYGLRSYNEHFFSKIGKNGGKLLDVGCGDGSFMEEAQKKGFEVFGLDLDQKSIDACKRKGLMVFNEMLTGFTADHSRFHNSFDVVTFFEVLEHQDAPIEFLQNIKKLVKPGGLIALSMPESIRFTGKFVHPYSWFGDASVFLSVIDFDFPPHHFTWWSPAVLSKFLSENGFKNIQFVCSKIDVSMRLDIMHSGVNKVFPKIGKIFPRWSYIPMALLPIGWSVNIYCQAQIN